MKIPMLLAKAKKLNARAWVCFVLFSLNMARTVTTVPPKTPATHLNKTICHNFWLIPKSVEATVMPSSEITKTGFLPNRSEAWMEVSNPSLLSSNRSTTLFYLSEMKHQLTFPHPIITHICTALNKLSITPE
jgi:hypothetical protein